MHDFLETDLVGHEAPQKVLLSMTCKSAYLTNLFSLFCRNEEVNNSANNSPQKSGNGFKLFQSNHNGANQAVSPPQNGSMSPSNGAPGPGPAAAPPQPNGILKNSYDRDAMSRVGQR